MPEIKNQIKVMIRSVYGVERIYPACEISKALADFKERLTFSRHDIELLKSIGFNVEIIQPHKF